MSDPVIAGMNATVSALDTPETPNPVAAAPSAVDPGPPRVLAIVFQDKTAFVQTTVGATELLTEERAKISAIAMKAFDRMLDDVRDAVQKNSGVKKRVRKANGVSRAGRPKLPRDAAGNIIRSASETSEPASAPAGA